jgi:NAD(P)-dependent dehydrogenase (short-subunit alcohol dehydrogenase family)
MGMGKLEQKVAMVTGASRGLGRAVALAFAREGASLAICARDGAALAVVADELRAMGAKVLAITADVANLHDVERFVSLTLREFGQIDVLLNNASILGPSPMPLLLDYPAADFEQVLRVNTLGPFLVTRQVLGAMLQRGTGAVINVTSEAGAVGFPGWGAYGVSKFALEGLTETWAAEVVETGVRVNMVDPGEMATKMHALAVPNCDYELARPEDVAEVMVYLASDEATSVHGQRIQAQEFLAGRGHV